MLIGELILFGIGAFIMGAGFGAMILGDGFNIGYLLGMFFASYPVVSSFVDILKITGA